MPAKGARTRSAGTLEDRLRRQLSLSLGHGLTATDTFIKLVRACALVTCLTLLGLLAGFGGLLAGFIFESSAQQAPLAASFAMLRSLLTVEFLIIGGFLSAEIVRSLLVSIHLKRFYRDEYLGTWSLLYHRVLGPELVVEDFWRQLYRKPTLFYNLKFPAYSKTLEDHLRFLAAFLEALRDTARGPLQIYYLHWTAGHGRIHRLRIRKILWTMIVLYPLLGFIPLLMLRTSVVWLLLGYAAFLLLAGSAMLAWEGALAVQQRARMKALCEFLLDEGGPDPQTLPPPPDIIGSRGRQWWVKTVERVARRLNWRGGLEE